MCGIVGKPGKQPAARDLVDALRWLGHRGFASASAATVEDGRL